MELTIGSKAIMIGKSIIPLEVKANNLKRAETQCAMARSVDNNGRSKFGLSPSFLLNPLAGGFLFSSLLHSKPLRRWKMTPDGFLVGCVVVGDTSKVVSTLL